MANDIVSVIVPIYNVERYVERCVNSIINQTYKDLEIILVNDGSTDGSYEIIRRYENDPRCRIINKPNGGLSSARNAGLDVAKGDYVYFIDSDDYIHPEAVELLLHRMQETSADFCCYRINYFSDQRSIDVGKNFEYDILSDPDAILRDALLGRNIKVTAWSKFYYTAFIRKYNLRFEKGIINEDYLFSAQTAIHARKVTFLNRVLYYAYERPQSISRDIKDDNILSYFKIAPLIKKALEHALIFEKYEDYYYASLTKQLLYTLVQSVFRLPCYTNFLSLYSLLDNSFYLQRKLGGSIQLLGRKYLWLYWLSLHPWWFYRTVRILKYIGVHMH